MFEIGDYVIYGTKGVCVVEEIGKIAMDGIPKDKLYYTLEPVYEKGSRIFTPVDHQKVIMRPAVSKEEALALIDEIPELEALWIPDDKMREQQFKGSLKTCDCRECIRIIKTLYLRKKARLSEGKKVTSGDNKYLKLSEDCLYGEFAIALNMNLDEVKAFIMDSIKNRIEI
ncbi:probable transcriptional regulator [Lachnospiraceae bacterium KM106-2]|nr:probable transcriptional regulator [Lachnospiraceae bacterium KM106-2]